MCAACPRGIVLFPPFISRDSVVALLDSVVALALLHLPRQMTRRAEPHWQLQVALFVYLVRLSTTVLRLLDVVLEQQLAPAVKAPDAKHAGASSAGRIDLVVTFIKRGDWVGSVATSLWSSLSLEIKVIVLGATFWWKPPHQLCFLVCYRTRETQTRWCHS
jgi:hypothetical protein